MLTVEPEPDEEACWDGETEAADEGLLDVGAARDEEECMQRASDGVEQLERDNLCIVERGTARLDITGERAGAGEQAEDLVGSRGAQREVFI